MNSLDEQIDELLAVDVDAVRITRRTNEEVRAKVRDDGIHEVAWTLFHGHGEWTCTCRPITAMAAWEPCVHIALVGRLTVVPVEGGDPDGV